MKLDQRTLERVLNQVVGAVTVPRQRARVTPQAGNVLGDRCAIHQHIIATPDLACDHVPDFIDAIAALVAAGSIAVKGVKRHAGGTDQRPAVELRFIGAPPMPAQAPSSATSNAPANAFVMQPPAESGVVAATPDGTV